MSLLRPLHRTRAYQPMLAWSAIAGTAWVFVLITLGAFTTSIGAGMVFPDWPLSNGSLNPDGWLHDLAMFSEHSHRLSAGLITAVTLAIAIAVWLKDSRSWMRKLAWIALGLVVAQAVVGGLRVLMDHLHVETVDTSVGRLFAMAHATLAQLYICSLIATSISLSRPWMEPSSYRPCGITTWRRTAVFCSCLLVIQLAVAAVMRHSFAGTAITTFPWSTAEGDLLPMVWNFRVAIHFTHRVLALCITVAFIVLVARISRDPTTSLRVKALAWGLLVLLAIQITLGAAAVLTYRNPYFTTSHVVVGAQTLALCFGLTWWSFRPAVQTLRPSPAPSRVTSQQTTSVA
ncbi:MAG: COX15/CtaA family protein [Opitutaceae bacterium]|nr:COX15/CtaA family protein [Opitutaceae bacterium]